MRSALKHKQDTPLQMFAAFQLKAAVSNCFLIKCHPCYGISEIFIKMNFELFTCVSSLITFAYALV